MEMPNSGEQYNLKWNNHLANFVQTFIEHQHEESLVDVTLSCEGQYIKAHKLVLSACSDYFHSIFKVHVGVQYPIVLLNGVRFSDLKYILHFIYHGEVKVVDNDLANVLALGETLQIKGLSSVKLRDMPPDNVSPPAQRAPRKNPRKEQNIKEQKTNTPPLRALPSEIPQFISINDNRAPFDYSKRKTSKLLTGKQVTQQISLPIITSVTSEATSSNTILVPESPPIHSTSKNEVFPTPNRPSVEEAKNTIPKPPHAFMIFANEWRKKLTIEHPEENNKEISIRLGTMWKNLLPETKNIYYREAIRAEEEHKLKYPNYVSPSESLKRKADVLNDTTNTTLPATSLDPMEVVEIQEHIAVSDSD